MKLHAYQERAICALRDAVLSGKRRVLLVAPTGAGKTVTIAALIQSAIAMGGCVLVVVHRLELVTQMRDTLARFGVSAGIIRADVPPEPLHRVQVGTIQTLVRRDLPRATIVIVDEAHRASAESYESVREAYPDALYIGLTATPCREDGKPLGEVFDALIEVARYSELITAGNIMAPICYGAPGGAPDLSAVHVRGDYVVGELELAMNQAVLVGGIVDNWKLHAEGRSTLVFAVGVAHSQTICAAFRAAGVDAAHLDGSSPEDERAETLALFAAGEITVLCNCALFIEGIDIPAAKCAVLARPTKSLALFMQGVGRVLRPHKGIVPVVLDHAGNCERHGLPHEDREWSLADKPKRKASEAPYKTCKACFGYIPAASRTCPLCGANLVEEKEQREQPTETKATLERIDEAARLAAKAAANTERAIFDRFVERARSMGFKPGFAGAKYKEKFGKWPPWAWSQEIKAAFANDEGWQKRLEHREIERERWLGKQRADTPPEPSREWIEQDFWPEGRE